MSADYLNEQFQTLYAKGRGFFARRAAVNLIGEHTDHNLGFVLPMAIDFRRGWQCATRRSPDRAALENLAATQEFDLDDSRYAGRGHWSDYIRGRGVAARTSWASACVAPNC